MSKVRTYLMFQGDAERAVDLYTSAFKDFVVGDVERYGDGEQVAAGSFRLAEVSFAGHELIIFNSPPVHEFSFTPSMSIFVDFDTQEALEAAFARLSEGGEAMMPLDDYGFSKRFGWIQQEIRLDCCSLWRLLATQSPGLTVSSDTKWTHNYN